MSRFRLLLPARDCCRSGARGAGLIEVRDGGAKDRRGGIPHRVGGEDIILC